MSKIFKLRRGTTSTMNNSKSNILLSTGEMFLEVPSNGINSGNGDCRIKVGDGENQYSDLSYSIGGPNMTFRDNEIIQESGVNISSTTTTSESDKSTFITAINQDIGYITSNHTLGEIVGSAKSALSRTSLLLENFEGGGSSGSSIQYSYEETEIGTWVDGSKVYQKVVPVTIPTTSADGTDAREDTNIGVNIDKLVKFDFVVWGSGWASALPVWKNISPEYHIRSYLSNNIIRTVNTCADYSGLQAFAIIQYTKLQNKIAIIPTMTSNTTPSGVASANSSYTNQPPYKAFNDTSNDPWASGVASGQTWLSYAFDSSQKAISFEYDFYTVPDRISSFSLYGDDTLLLTQNGPFTTGTHEISIPSNLQDFYSTYKLVIASTGRAHVDKFQLYAEYVSIDTTDSNNWSVSNDRAGIMSFSTDGLTFTRTAQAYGAATACYNNIIDLSQYSTMVIVTDFTDNTTGVAIGFSSNTTLGTNYVGQYVDSNSFVSLVEGENIIDISSFNDSKYLKYGTNSNSVAHLGTFTIKSIYLY